MRVSNILHFAVSRTGTLFAAAGFDCPISIWDLETQAKLHEFPSRDFSRVAITADGQHLVSAGIWPSPHCYHLPSGKMLWQRKDLKGACRLSFLPSQTEIACAYDDHPLLILNLPDGKILRKVRPCKNLFVSPFDPVQLVDKLRPDLRALDGSLICHLAREPMERVSVAFGHGAVAYSEPSGRLHCLTTTGELLWKYQSPRGHHCPEIGYHEASRRFLAVEFDPHKNTGTLLAFDPKNGQPTLKFPLGPSALETFCLDGTRLLSSSGWLLDTSTTQIVGRFPFPMTNHPGL